MPNEQKDNLFLLVKSLTKVEKRHFKLYASRNQISKDSKFIRLFDVLDGMKDYIEEIIFRKEKTIKRSQLPNLKAHLYGEILVALRLLHSSKNLDMQIREQFDFAKLLYDRGLILQSLKILDKAKSLAKSNGHFILTLEIIQFEKTIESRHITRSIKGRANDLAEETGFIVQQVNEVSELSTIALQMYGLYLETGHAQNEIQSREIEMIFKGSIKNINTKQISFFGKAYLQQAYCWYYYIQLDFPNYYRHSKKWVQLFEVHPNAKKEDPFLYLKALHNLASALFILGKFEELDNEIFKLEKIYDIASGYNESLRIQAFVYLYTAKINTYFLKGEFTKGLNIVPEIENHLKQYNRYIDTHRVMVFHYKIASLYFGSGNNEKCIQYLNKIINLKVGYLRSDIQCFARILHLVAHYELGNTEILEYLIKSVYRFLAKMENLDAVLREILKFLKRSLNPAPRNVTESFIDLRNRLEAVSQNKYARRSYQYLDIVSWLESKIKNVPVENIIRDKFMKKKNS